MLLPRNWVKITRKYIISLMKGQRKAKRVHNDLCRSIVFAVQYYFILYSGKECHERWILRHHRNKKPFRKSWSEEEDALVMQLVMGSEELPFTKWTELASHFPGRNGKQLRDRFKNCLNPSICHYPFSRDEDLLLYAAHQAMGPRWVDVSVQFFKSTRSENQVKNRWNSAAYKKFVAEEFGPFANVGSTSSTQSWTDPNSKKRMARFSSPSQLIDSTTTNGLVDLT
jgi:Myb-like DNA-binding domain